MSGGPWAAGCTAADNRRPEAQRSAPVHTLQNASALPGVGSNRPGHPADPKRCPEEAVGHRRRGHAPPGDMGRLWSLARHMANKSSPNPSTGAWLEDFLARYTPDTAPQQAPDDLDHPQPPEPNRPPPPRPTNLRGKARRRRSYPWLPLHRGRTQQRHQEGEGHSPRPGRRHCRHDPCLADDG